MFRGLLGLWEERLILTVFPPSPDQPNIHLPGDLGDAHRKEVERTLRRHPSHALGLVVNPALPQPAGWGSKPEEKRKDGSPRIWGASNDHIRGAVAIWAECDGGLSIEEQGKLPELAGLPAPTFRVWSGNKSLHLYWAVNDEWFLDPEQFRSLQRRLAAAIKAVCPEAKPDEGIHNPCRVMRLAGGLHPKTGRRCTFLEQEDWPAYSPEELERLIPPLPSSSSSGSSGKSSSSSSPSMGGGSGWFDRLTPERQEATAVEMLRRVPLRTEAGQGLYGDSFKILAGLVHHFGETTAVEICERAGWRSDAWDPSSKAQTIRPIDRAADVGNLIGAARDHGWRHPLALEEERLADRFGIESPRPVVITEQAAEAAGETSSSSSSRKDRLTFAQRKQAMEAAADRLAASEEPGVWVAAELAEAASELDLARLTRRDLETLLEAAQRRLRPAAAPILPGGRFKVRPALWAVAGLVRHGLNLLTGAPGAGKTRFALGCAAAWLKGEPSWLGLDLEDSKPVEERELLIIGPDQDLTDWVVALEPLGLVRRLEDGECELHPRVTLHPMEAGILLDGDGLTTVRRWCDQHPGGLVVADCLAQLLPGGADEDKASAARPVHALAEALGSCWGLLLHHTRKAAGRERNVGIGAARGSSAIEAAVSRVLSLGLLHRKEGGEWVAQEGDDRRELISTKRGGPTVHLIVRSDANGAWHNEGSAEDLRREEKRQSALGNLTELQQEALAALETAPDRLTTRKVWEAMGRDWEEDKAAGGAGSALLRKVLRRLGELGLVETTLEGKERSYRLVASSSPSTGIEAEGGDYESPERLADIREERIPQAVREERDTNRVWEAQHRQRTEREGELLEAQQQSEEAPLEPVLTLVAERSEEAPLPLVGELVEIADGRGGWQGGYEVAGVSSSSITLRSLATGKTLTKRPSAKRSPWRRPEDQQQSLLLAA
jgi:hypothetical protein